MTLLGRLAMFIAVLHAALSAWAADAPLPNTEVPDFSGLPPIERNAAQANQALKQCRRYVEGWLAHADPETGLIPRNLRESKDIWNGKDSAADNYPFMVMTCALTDRAMFKGRMRDMLETETRVTSRVGPLVDVYSFSQQDFAHGEPDMARIIFDSSEYVKDGLMPLTELLGPSPWSERMLDLTGGILEHAAHPTPGGPIPSGNVEVNGEMMQVLGRLYWMTGDEVFLDMGIRIADYYLLGEHHPTQDMDSLRLDDHGCELVSGLCEIYVTCHYARPEKKAAYGEPLYAMLDRILEIGVDEHGFMYHDINPVAGTVRNNSLSDNWGYNYNGFYAVYMVDGVARYREAARKPLRSLGKPEFLAYPWEGWGSDGIADVVEGALNLYNRMRVKSAVRWIDANIHRMLGIQQKDGVIEGWHGDGNFARTAIMWALWKQQGVTVHPWREDVQLGAIEIRHGVRILVKADEPWSGELRFDTPRHKTVLNLPVDYPRINQFPEWFTVDTAETYRVQADKVSGTQVSGARLRDGYPLTLASEQEVYLEITTE